MKVYRQSDIQTSQMNDVYVRVYRKQSPLIYMKDRRYHIDCMTRMLDVLASLHYKQYHKLK